MRYNPTIKYVHRIICPRSLGRVLICILNQIIGEEGVGQN